MAVSDQALTALLGQNFPFLSTGVQVWRELHFCLKTTHMAAALVAVLPYRVRYAPVCPKCTIAEEVYSVCLCIRLCVVCTWVS